jgi:aspartate ammonia-lyase
MRKEKDFIGEVQFESNIAYGIQSYRAMQNFPRSGEKCNLNLIKAYLQVKRAAALTNFKFKLLPEDIYQQIDRSIDTLLYLADECLAGKNDKIYLNIVVDPYQGGAGTSLNMNLNEVIANYALREMGKKFGYYEFIHPLDHVNLSQSTNDTFPTALKIAAIVLLREMQESFANLQNEFQEKEKEFRNVLKLGRTQLQDAVPITLGQEFGAYAQAIARDRWRFYNAEERLRSVNLGGTAVGNSIAANNNYVLNVVNELRDITGLPIAKAEDLIEATQNLDVFVEVHGIVKAGATSIIKICSDLRLLSSGPEGGFGEIILPQMQAGSTIMPGKVNPVILENAIQLCELVKGNDVTISNLISAGNLELNQFLPATAHLFLKSLELLRDCSNNLKEKCISGIKANRKRCAENLINSKAIAGTLITEYGYDKIAEAIKISEEKNKPFILVLKEDFNITEDNLKRILERELGISIEFNT